MYYDNDFYNEPSEFDMQVDEFKQSLLESVKDEYKSEMELLRKENADLQEVKRNYEQIKQEYKNKIVELEQQKSNLRYEVRRERLKDLMKDFEVVLYRAYSKSKSGPKCNKCDEERNIYYKSPLGKQLVEQCDCKNNITYYEPRKYVCTSLASRDGKFMAWYTQYDDNNIDGFKLNSFDSSFTAKFIYSSEKFEDINEKSWDVYFKTEEECQAYCDWLFEHKGESK